MDLNEMRRRFKEQKAQSKENCHIDNDSDVTIIDSSPSNSLKGDESVRYSDNSIQTLQFDDGACYVGSLDENGKLFGHGVYTFPDGTVYDGLWENGMRNGAGTQTWKDGVKYVGNWKDGLRHGTGSMTWPDGSCYKGRWKNDNIIAGDYYYSDGDHYSGDFNPGWEREGSGIYYWNDGSHYIGFWKKNLRNGKGQYFDKNGKLVNDGEWINDKFVDNASQNRVPIPDSWSDATKRAINLLYKLEKCNYAERRSSLSIVEQLHVPPKYEASWNQILRIWRKFAKDLKVDTNTLPNPDGVKFSKRPYPITGSVGVQELIKEIIKNS